jgi:hypothetical protein
MQRINHPVFIHMEIEGVVRVIGVVRVAVLRLVPADDLAHIFNDGLALSDVLQGKHAFAMHPGAAHLNALAGCAWRGTAGGRCRCFGHGVENLLW